MDDYGFRPHLEYIYASMITVIGMHLPNAAKKKSERLIFFKVYCIIIILVIAAPR